jgi:hypothetical protein
MAQVLKLKRTAVQGKIPTTDTLELGELAINTYDGKLYFEKDNGIPSIQTIVVTDALITGSLNINGAITASYFIGNGSQITFGGTGMVSGSSQLTSSLDSRYLNTLGEGTISGSFTGSFGGDGSGLTNLPASDISQVATVNYAFFNSSNISVSHNFNSRNVIISVYDSNYAQIIPSSVTLTDLNTATIVLTSAQSGYAVVAKGGHIVSGSADDSNKLNGESGSYYLDYTNHTNKPSGLVSGSSQIVSILSSLNSYTQSQDTKNSTLTTYTASIDNELDRIQESTASLNTYTSSLKTALELTGSNVVVLGDLIVRGTTTSVNSTTIQLGDNIIELNGTGVANGGLLVKDSTGGSTISGSLLWDSTNDYWKSGISGSESKILLASGDNVVSGSSQITFSGISSLPTLISGSIQILGGSNIVSSSTQILSSLVSQSINLANGAITASYFVGDGSGITNVVTEIAEVATVTSSFDTQSTISVTHNFNTKNVLVSVYGTNDSQIIPSSVTLTNNNTATIILSSAQSGYAVVAKGGHIVSGSTSFANLAGTPSGLVSGSSQITALTTYKETVSGNSTYSITHSLNEEYPIVQAWNTANKRQEVPSIIESTSVNALSITFAGVFAGLIIIKK